MKTKMTGPLADTYTIYVILYNYVFFTIQSAYSIILILLVILFVLVHIGMICVKSNSVLYFAN